MTFRCPIGAARERSGCHPARLAVAVVVAALALSGCRFGALSQNLRTFDENGFLNGTVVLPAGGVGGQVVVFAVPTEGDAARAADWTVLAGSGPYFLVVPVGEYRVGAFLDRDRSLSHVAGEPATWAKSGAPVVARPGAKTTGVDMTLDSAVASPMVAVEFPMRGSGEVHELPASRIGELVALDDPRFGEEQARLGLWQPVDFLIDVGAGIYFLEPYDPARIPVLFVHGALGHPGNFATLAASLDRRVYQAWFAYYPTAVGLDIVAAAFDRWVQALEVEYGFKRLVVVAHSMGGLVVRRFLAGDRDRRTRTLEKLTFVSIATPWQGHAAAARGVDRAPVVAPSWFDMAPGSPFLTALFDAPLPRYAVHDLYFTFGDSRRRSVANDGVVTLASQLDRRAQLQARRILGFDAGHAAVLREPLVVEELQRSLAGVR